ncbi:MAG: response regulator, partial [Mucilaginibacter sp.]|nr:response regulator [Mucilaginibacter sp.]
MLKLSFRNQVLAGFAVSIILVFIVGILSYNSINKLESDTGMVEHTQRVIKTSTNLLQQLIDAETGMRGYAATGKRTFLDPYNAAIPSINSDLSDLRGLIPDNPVQVKRVDSLSALVSAELNILKTNIETYDSKGLAYMVQANMFVNGKQSMDQIRKTIANMIDTENELLAIRKASSRVASTNAIIFIAVGSLIFLLIIIVLFYYIQRTFSEQKKIENEIKITNIELEKVLGENEAKNWLLTGTGLLNEKMQGQQSERELSENILAEVCSYTQALTGTLYLYNEKETRLDLYSTYAFSNIAAVKQTITLGEGWIGQ